MQEGFLFSTSYPAFIVFDYSHSDQCEVVSHCSFDLHFSNMSEKVGLKLNIQKTKIMASGPITTWEIDGETVETVSDFILGGSKITADSDCSHEIKRRLLLGRKVMTNLEKQRHYFANKGSSGQGYGFSSGHVWM